MLDNDTRQQYWIPSGDECVALGHAMDDLLGKLAARHRMIQKGLPRRSPATTGLEEAQQIVRTLREILPGWVASGQRVTAAMQRAGVTNAVQEAIYTLLDEKDGDPDRL